MVVTAERRKRPVLDDLLVILPDSYSDIPDPDGEEDGEAIDRLQETADTIERELDQELSWEEKRRRSRVFTARVTRAAFLVTGIALFFPLVYGWSYYASPLLARPFHPFHSYLRPSGYIGLSCGVLGTLLIALSLWYLVVKKRAESQMHWERVRRWMSIHVVTGFLGPCFIVVHTGLIPTSSLGLVSAVAMVVVVASGMIGKFVLTAMPAKLEGGESGREEVCRRIDVYRAKLLAMGVDPHLVAVDKGEDSSGLPRRTSFLTGLVRVLRGDRESKLEYQRLKSLVQHHGALGEEAHVELILLRRLCQERQFLVRYYELRRIMGTWRFLHRWLAITLIFGAFFHIVLAVRHGELWILFGGAP